VSNINNFTSIGDNRDYPVVVASDVENNKFTYEVGVGEKVFDRVKTVEFGPSDDIAPPLKATAGFGVILDEGLYSPPRDKSHSLPPGKVFSFFLSFLMGCNGSSIF
jgi:hypothetical protein